MRQKQNISLIEEYEIPNRCEFDKGDIIDQFQIEKKLGEGTFGIVYKVRCLDTGSTFALKLLKLWELAQEKERRHMLKRFKREYLCGQIPSTYLVGSVGFGKKEGNPYIIMEYCPNGSLADLVGKANNFDQINQWSYQILSGLKCLHDSGKFHRDIKPENILLDKNLTAKVTDFGIAGFLQDRLTRVNRLGLTSQIFGTYAYIAPEQLDKRKAFKAMSAVADVFSFGVTMYEVLTGTFPFGPLSSHSDLANYQERASKGEWTNVKTFRPDLQDVWEEIFEKSLHVDYKRHRFQNVDEIIELLGYKINGKILHRPTANLIRSSNGRPGDWVLEIMDGEEIGKSYNLNLLLKGQSGLITLGWLDPNRIGRNYIEIKETQTEYISNFHATLEKVPSKDQWYIRDGQWRKIKEHSAWHYSTNGVVVNSYEIGRNPILLNNGDIIIVGDTSMRVNKI